MKYTKRKIDKAIYLTAASNRDRRAGYRVVHNLHPEAIVCLVPTVSVGNCIVKALRQRAYDKLLDKR